MHYLERDDSCGSKTAHAIPSPRILFAVILAGLVACSGDERSSPLDSGPVESTSFSPSTGLLADGSEATRLWWSYELNGGEPLRVVEGNTELSMGVDEARVTIEPKNKLRKVSLGGTMEGSSSGSAVTGTWSTEAEADLALEDGTQFVQERLRTTQAFSVQGMSARATVDMLATHTPAWRWALDRTDLTELAAGTRFDSTVQTAFSGSATVNVDGQRQSETIPEQTVPVSDTWTVLQTHPMLEVRGTVYRDVVEVERRTSVPDLETGTTVSSNGTYFVVRGVGLVRATNLIEVAGQSDVTWELLDTNLMPAAVE